GLLAAAMLIIYLALFGQGCVTLHVNPEPAPKATPAPTLPPKPSPTPKPMPRKLTNGVAVFEVDLSGFATAPGSDTDVLLTMLWEPAPGWPKRPTSPALQLGLR